MPKKLRCYIGLHRFQRRRAEDGSAYKECRDCEKFLDQTATSITVRRGRFPRDRGG